MLPLLAPILGTVIDRLVPDTAEAERLKAETEASLIKAANEVNLAQIETNKVEAAHRSIFVAGWRPAIGWACALGFAWAFLGQPLALWGIALAGSDVALPALDTAPLTEMAFAMLGLAGLRTYEKQRGVAK